MPVPDDFDFDLWADMAHEMKLKGKEPKTVLPSDESLKPVVEPEPYDGIEALHTLVASRTGEPVPSWVVEDRALMKFAYELWEAAYDQGTEDLSRCCGCSGGPTTPNPFKEFHESHE